MQRPLKGHDDQVGAPPFGQHSALQADPARPGVPGRVVVWDLPLRLFHGTLAAAVSTALLTGWVGGSWMAVHGQAGLLVAGLLGFRVAWGLLGSRHARFASFAPSPASLLAYLRGRWQGLGHNPLGALSVFALLGSLALQVGTGVAGNDDIAYTGPLYAWVSEEFSLVLTGLHRRLASVLYVLVGLHVLAIAFYVHVKRKPLLGPMLRGWAHLPPDAGHHTAAPPERDWRGGGAALLISTALGISAWLVASGALQPPADVGGAATPADVEPAAGTQAAARASSVPPVVRPAAPAW